jgi:cell wall-associated NlpC family hydrolase
VHTSRPASRVVKQRIAAVTTAIVSAGLMISITGSAGATPTPTLAQAQKKAAQLVAKSERLDQQYDQVKQQLAATDQRLGLVDKELAKFSAQFASERGQISRIAVTAYEDGNITSSVELLTSGDPQEILDQSSILEELSASDNAQISQFLSAARQLEDTQRLAQRTRDGIVELKTSLAKRKAALGKLVTQEQSLVSDLTPAQQTGIGPGGGTSKPVKYTGPTGSQADTAVAFAYKQLGCPYVYGGTGPCDQGFDCSGLTMESWAAAGVSIPRTSYEQWDDLPHVALDAVQPGDILVFFDAGHVALYVGNNEFIQAPQPDQDVQLVTYQGANTPGIDGAVVP